MSAPESAGLHSSAIEFRTATPEHEHNMVSSTIKAQAEESQSLSPELPSPIHHLPQERVTENAVDAPTSHHDVIPDEVRTVLLEAEFSDIGNAERIVALHGRDWIHVDGVADHMWCGTHWKSASKETILAFAVNTVKTMQALSETIKAQHLRQPLQDHVKRFSRATSLRGAISIAATLGEIQVDISKLDAEVDYLPVLNGRLNLRTKELEPHKRDAYDTRIAPVKYDPHASHWAVDELLRLIESNGTLPTVQQVLGSALSGRVEKRFWAFYGPSSTGKSTILGAIEALLGPFAQSVEQSTISQASSPPGSPRSDLAKLQGARLVIVPEYHGRLNMSLIKRFTGLDTVSARFLRQNEFSFVATFSLITHGNMRPSFDSEEDGTKSRAVEIPFLNRPARLDTRIRSALAEPKARSALLNFLLDGCAQWYDRSFDTYLTSRVIEATQEFHKEMSPFDEWAIDYIEFEPGRWTSSNALYGSYREWAKVNGVREIAKPKALTLWLAKQRDFVVTGEKARRSEGRGVEGVGLTSA